jgi:hypothetical protein
MRDVTNEMESLSQSQGGWLDAEAVQRAGLLGVLIYDSDFELNHVVAVNPRSREARVCNLDKQGRIKLNRTRDEVQTRVVRMKQPNYFLHT